MLPFGLQGHDLRVISMVLSQAGNQKALHAVQALLASVLGILLFFAAFHGRQHTSADPGHSTLTCLLCTLANAQAEPVSASPIIVEWQPGISFSVPRLREPVFASILPLLPSGRAPPVSTVGPTVRQ
jgi:hypothetical protein